MRITTIISILILIAGSKVYGQELDSLTLDQAIFLAHHKSLLAARAKRDYTQSYWQYRGETATWKPELTLSGTLPNYTQSFQEVVQPDGLISFRPIRNDNSFLGAQVTQSILPTGGVIFVRSNLQRYTDFVTDDLQYNGIPVRVGIQQSLTGFNETKWNRMLTKVNYTIAERSLIMDMERVALETTLYYFEVLSAQTNVLIAENNLENNNKLYGIAEERLKLGKISKEDFLQLKLEWVNAKKSKQDADRQMKSAVAALRSWLTLGDVAAPLKVIAPEIDYEKLPINFGQALSKAKINRPDWKEMERLELEANRELKRTKTEGRFSADLTASLGLTGSGTNSDEVYTNMQEEQNLSLSFSIPLVDWGRRKSSIRIAKAQREYVETFRANQEQTIAAEVIDVVANYNNMLHTIQLMEEARQIATDRFGISTERYIMGHISTTEYTLSQRSKDDMQRTYANAIKDYWYAHYLLRVTTLYDFDKNNNINYKYN